MYREKHENRKDFLASFSFAVFSAKNILVVLAVMISLSVVESSMVFFLIKLPIYL